MLKLIQVSWIKYKNLSKPIKASLWFTACYIIQRGLQFIGIPIYTRIMPMDQYGQYSTFLSWFNFLCVITSLSIYSGTFNTAMIKYENDRDRYISAVQSLTFLISAGFSLCILLLHKYISYLTGYNIFFQLLLCIHLTLYPTLQYWSQKQRFLFEYKKLVLVTLINSLLSLLFGIVFVAISKNKALVLVFVTVIVQALINVVLYISLHIKGKCFYNKQYWNWTIKTALPLLPHYISEILLGHADRLMISQMCGITQAGIYNIVYQISMVMTIIRTGINGAFIPWLYYSIREKKYDAIKKATNLLIAMMALLTLLFMLIGPEILKIAAPSTYYEAVVDIPAIMIGGFYIFIYVLFMNIEVYYEKTRVVSIASALAATLNIILNYIFINEFGYLAAGYTTMISYISMAILHFIFLKGIINNNPEINLMYDFRFIFAASLFVVLAGILALFLYAYFFIRFLGIIVCLAIIIVNRKKLLYYVDCMRKTDSANSKK